MIWEEGKEEGCEFFSSVNPACFSFSSNAKSVFIKRRCLGLAIFTWLGSHWKKKNIFLVTLCIQIEKILKHENASRYSVSSFPSHWDGDHPGFLAAVRSIWVACGSVILQQTWAPSLGGLGCISIISAKASVAFHQHKQYKAEHVVIS